MDKVEIRVISKPCHEPVILFPDMQLIPTHVRDLESGILGEVNHLSAKGTQALNSRRLLAGVEEKLISKANAKVGPVVFNPLLDHFPESCLTELAGTITERTYSRNHKCRATSCIGFFEYMDALRPGMLNGSLHAAKITTAVVDETKQGRAHSTPLVLGIPETRGSCETAISRALPRALKIASAM
jgi:hypothetical protein